VQNAIKDALLSPDGNDAATLIDQCIDITKGVRAHRLVMSRLREIQIDRGVQPAHVWLPRAPNETRWFSKDDAVSSVLHVNNDLRTLSHEVGWPLTS